VEGPEARRGEDIVEIQRADPEQASRLKQTAVAAKSYWGYSREWMAKWESLLSVPPAYIRDNQVYVASEDGEIMGFYALVYHGDVCELDHLWVIPARIGTGIGRILFTHALQCASALGATRLEWEADPHAVGFYQRMGGHYLRDTVTELEGTLPIMGLDLDSSSRPAQPV
jgi:GNAT superfamily N-acetyltransferase